MEIVKKIIEKVKDNKNKASVTIAFLGDSVTQGCFECYIDENNEIQTVFDKNSAYHNYVAKIFSVLYPTVPINIINAGISGDNAPHGYERLERDVLCHNPDLVVVCFGLNDSGKGKDGLSLYTQALENIFKKLQAENKEIIFMTPNMMNTTISPRLPDERMKDTALFTLEKQLSGILDMYIEAAMKTAEKNGVRICDCYGKWKQLEACGVNITELLANKINHPTREMNMLFAYSLVETMLS